MTEERTEERTVVVRAGRDDEEQKRLARRVRSTWGDAVVRRGAAVDPAEGSLVGAFLDEEIVGVASYAVRDDGCEVVAIEAYQQRQGVATALLDEIREQARASGCRRLWLITTNDNVPAIALYQRWGMDLLALRHDAVTAARVQLKPSIPETGFEGIPIRHELEFALEL